LLPLRIYEQIRAEAIRRGLPATVVARRILRDGLRERRRREVRKKIAEYARPYAGAAPDFDSAFDCAGIEPPPRSKGKRSGRGDATQGV